LSRGTRLTSVATIVEGILFLIGHKVAVAVRCGSTTGREIRTITGGVLRYKDWLSIRELGLLLSAL